MADFAMKIRLRDADLLAETVQGWDLDFRQLECGPVDAILAHVRCGPVLITECAMNRRIEQHGAAPAGFRTIAVPANDRMEVRWRGRDHAGSSMMLFRPDGDLDSVSDPRFHVYTVSVAEEWLAVLADRSETDFFKVFTTGSDVIECPGTGQSVLRGMLADLVAAATSIPAAIPSAGFQEAVQRELVTTLFDTANAGRPVKKRPMARRRSEALRSAIETIKDRADEPVAIAELVKISGVSTRTLRYAFLEAFGITPKQYIQSSRLHRAHRQLREAAGENARIADIANACGFWHMGQFAKDYRRMFGELPSETLGRLVPAKVDRNR